MLDEDQYYVRQGSILCKTRINNRLDYDQYYVTTMINVLLDKDQYHVRQGSILC